jgi:hypothetical protein
MKQVVQSLYTAIRRSNPIRVEIRGAQAPEAEMRELSVSELRLVAGGGQLGPHGSWSQTGQGD